ncbi:hypothetical protein DPMN_194351 [Dreissena polymorpha]|uniref:Uncharacterized protein n=1 Tax=Dreissena polymorpha TaxID=45954 RepID=A0A9D4BF77_DREPO|nr:hypothetical protein DPMN_194351 [Dreissena polymorpha]
MVLADSANCCLLLDILVPASNFHLEWFSQLVVVDDSALKVFVQGPDDVDKFLRDAIMSQNLPELSKVF